MFSYLASLSYLKGYSDAPNIVLPVKAAQIIYEDTNKAIPTATRVTKLTVISESIDRLEMEIDYFYDGSLGETTTLCGGIKVSYDPDNIHHYWSCRPSGISKGKGRAKLSFGLSEASHQKSEIIISDQITIEFYSHNPYRTSQLSTTNYYKAWIPEKFIEKQQPKWRKASGLAYLQGFYQQVFN